MLDLMILQKPPQYSRSVPPCEPCRSFHQTTWVVANRHAADTIDTDEPRNPKPPPLLSHLVRNSVLRDLAAKKEE